MDLIDDTNVSNITKIAAIISSNATMQFTIFLKNLWRANVVVNATVIPNTKPVINDIKLKLIYSTLIQ